MLNATCCWQQLCSEIWVLEKCPKTDRILYNQDINLSVYPLLHTQTYNQTLFTAFGV